MFLKRFKQENLLDITVSNIFFRAAAN